MILFFFFQNAKKELILFDLCVCFFTLTSDEKKRFMIFYNLLVLSLKKNLKSRVLTCGLSGEQRDGEVTDYRRVFDRLTGVSCSVDAHARAQVHARRLRINPPTPRHNADK